MAVRRARPGTRCTARTPHRCIARSPQRRPQARDTAPGSGLCQCEMCTPLHKHAPRARVRLAPLAAEPLAASRARARHDGRSLSGLRFCSAACWPHQARRPDTSGAACPHRPALLRAHRLLHHLDIMANQPRRKHGGRPLANDAARERSTWLFQGSATPRGNARELSPDLEKKAVACRTVASMLWQQAALNRKSI